MGTRTGFTELRLRNPCPPDLNGILVPDGGVDGTNTIAYCRDVGPTTVALRAVDTSGTRSGPSNELTITC